METTILQAPKSVPVRAHRFATGPEYTVGIEEELMLLDADDLALAPGVEQIVSGVSDDRVKPELMRCQIEVATSPSRSVAGALDDLLDLRSRVIRVAAEHALRVAGCGTHPYSLAEDQQLTARDRYRELAAELRYPLRREVCFGMHVHVAVGGPDKAMRVIEAMLADLPLLLAVSASSPFWRGEPTGLRSTRTVVFQSLPRSGLPPAFGSYEDYALGVERLQRAGAILDHSYLWWDIRPHPRFGTIEVRSLDVQPRALDSVAIAGLVQALVRHYGRRYDHGERFPEADRFVVGENRWLAARHGLNAPHRRYRLRHLDVGSPLLSSTCSTDSRTTPPRSTRRSALDRIASMVKDGTSADRQLALHRHGASLPEIVQSVADETIAREP